MTIDIRDGQPQLADLLDLMAAGDEVLIVEGDRRLAKLPYRGAQDRACRGVDTRRYLDQR